MSMRLTNSAIFAVAAGSIAILPAFAGEFAVPKVAAPDRVGIVLAGGMGGGGGGMSGGGGGMSGGGGGMGGGGGGWRWEWAVAISEGWATVPLAAAHSAVRLAPTSSHPNTRGAAAARPTAIAINALHPPGVARLSPPPGCGRVRCAAAPIVRATAARPKAASSNLAGTGTGKVAGRRLPVADYSNVILPAPLTCVLRCFGLP